MCVLARVGNRFTLAVIASSAVLMTLSLALIRAFGTLTPLGTEPERTPRSPIRRHGISRRSCDRTL